MVRRRAVLAAFVLCAALPGTVRGITTEVLFRSGDAAVDGTRLDQVEAPLVAGSAVAFRGGTSAILLAHDGEFSVIAASGDALPISIEGTFSGFGDPLVNAAGTVAFSAGFNAANAAGGVMLFENGTLLEILRAPRLTVGLNDNSDVLLRTANQLSLWDRATAKVVRLVDRRIALPGGGPGRFVRIGRRAALNDEQVAVFQAEVTATEKPTRRRGIFTVGGGTVTLLAREGDPAPVPGGIFARFRTLGRDPNEAVSINGAGAVAFTAPVDLDGSITFGVFTGGPGLPVRPVALVGDDVDGNALLTIPTEYVGIDTAGRVIFKGCTAAETCQLIASSGGRLTALTANIERRTSGGRVVPATGFASGLTDGGRLAWQSEEDIVRYDGTTSLVLGATDATPIGTGLVTGPPSINDAGMVTFRAGHEAVYLLENGAARAIASGGNSIAGGGTIRSFATHAFGGERLTVLAREYDGRRVIAVQEGAGLRKLVADGDPTPIGGIFGLEEGALASTPRGAVFIASVQNGKAPGGVFRAGYDGSMAVLARLGKRAPGGGEFETFQTIEADGDLVVFSATLSPNGEGLYALRGRRLTKIARTRTRLPGFGRGRLNEIGFFAVGGGSVVFGARRPGEIGLVRWHGGRVKRIAPGNGLARTPRGFPALALSTRRTAFLAGLRGTGPEQTLFFHEAKQIVPVLDTGASLATGERVGLLGQGTSLLMFGDGVILRAELRRGPSVRVGLLRILP
jgi:hypothetical protein